jgi:hypothetical protein
MAASRFSWSWVKFVVVVGDVWTCHRILRDRRVAVQLVMGEVGGGGGARVDLSPDSPTL